MPIGGPLVINHVILDGSSSIGLLVHCRQANKLSLVRRGLLVYTRQSPASPGDDTLGDEPVMCSRVLPQLVSNDM
jgi:hypothetical protein